MCECLTDQKLTGVKHLIENLFRGCKMLRSIDISKNQLSKENINCFFKMVEQSQIECLAISQINLQRDNCSQLINVTQGLTNLRKLNISGNEKIGGQTMQQILRALIKNKSVEELDISQTGIGNDHICMQLLGELIQKNPNLKSIGLQSLGLSEKVAAYHLIDPLSKALNIESLNFQNNNLGPIFVQNLVEKLISNKKDNIAVLNSPGSQSRDSSIMTESEVEIPTSRGQGLLNINFELNPHIGDRGAGAIGDLIST